jgi:hypothetical protein
VAGKRKNPTRKQLEALDRAQELVDEARHASSVKRGAELAMEAIRVSPLCADAWSVLAAVAEPGSDQQLTCLTEAIAAGEAAIGASFEEMVGEFWGWPETRPYMRAKGFLAGALWKRGRGIEALAEFRHSGDTDASRKALRAAVKSNKYVAPILLGTEKLPKVQPAFYSIGDRNEAVFYAADFIFGWQSTPGAIEWVAKTTSGPTSSRPANRK